MASCILAAPSLWMRGARRVIHIFWPLVYLTVQFGTLYHWNKGEGNQIGLVISFFGLYNQVKLQYVYLQQYVALYHLQIIHIHDTHMYNRGIFHCAFSKRNLCIQKCASWLLSLFSYHWGAVMSETWLLVSATQLLQGKRQCGHISSEYK